MSPWTADVDSADAATAVLRAWGLLGPRPVLVCVGGAGGLDEHLDAVRDVLREQVLPLLAERGGLVVDGGTRSGIMRLLGEAVGDLPVPLLGVAAAGTVRVPGRPAPRERAAQLDPRHRAVLLVDGKEWGDESPWLSTVAGLVAGSRPSATLLINGGEIAYQDAAYSVAALRPVVVVAGTGRAADTIATAKTTLGDDGSTDPRALALARSGLVRAVGIHDPAAVATAIAEALA
jgi:TRPM family ion channel